MKAKGSIPGKAPRDLLLILISGTDTQVHMGISIPESILSKYQIDDIKQFSNLITEFRTVTSELIKDKTGSFLISHFDSEYPLKERDVILQNAFNELKRRKIYIDSEEDDPIYDF